MRPRTRPPPRSAAPSLKVQPERPVRIGSSSLKLQEEVQKAFILPPLLRLGAPPSGGLQDLLVRCLGSPAGRSCQGETGRCGCISDGRCCFCSCLTWLLSSVCKQEADQKSCCDGWIHVKETNQFSSALFFFFDTLSAEKL